MIALAPLSAAFAVGVFAAETGDGVDLVPPKVSVTQKVASALRTLPLGLYARLPQAARAAALAQQHGGSGSFAERLERVTRGFLGAPYVLSPLGEGVPPDADPRFRLDAFDCTTFVETAIATAYHANWIEVERELDAIRYSAPHPVFAARRHLIESQWIPGLSQAGYIEDITESVGADTVRWHTFVLTKERWGKRRIARGLALDPPQVPVGEYRIPLIPLEAVHPEQLPPGAIINVLRYDVPWSPLMITHQGIVLLRPGTSERIIRHASPGFHRVIDEPLVRRLARYRKPRAWPFLGINVQRIRELNEH